MLLVVKNLTITSGVLKSNSQSCDQKQLAKHQIDSLYEERGKKRERKRMHNRYQTIVQTEGKTRYFKNIDMGRKLSYKKSKSKILRITSSDFKQYFKSTLRKETKVER